MDMTILAKKAKTMDRISQLPDELLLRILSFLPTTKYVVETMVLSQRWQFLWTMVPRLVYNYYYSQKHSNEELTRFVHRSLLLHEAPAIEALHFILEEVRDSKDIQVWIRAAEKRSVRELIIMIENFESPPVAELPRSLYRSYRMLVTLELCNAVLVDDVTCPVSFPFLKKLNLVYMKYPNDVFLDKLLSGCPVLEDLVVEQRQDDNVPIIRVRMLHLKSLTLRTSEDRAEGEEHGFVIDAPSLECLDIVDYHRGFCVIVNNLSKILKAKLYYNGGHHNEKLVGSITSAKRLCLCLPTSKDIYPAGTVFRRLVHLEICTCGTEWLNQLMRMLNDSPNLQSLKLRKDFYVDVLPRPCWNKPSSVPECLLTTLKTFQWDVYEGTEEEKEVVAFILRNGCCLEKVTISSESTTDRDKKLEMIKELTLLPRSSRTCGIKFF